MSILLVTGLLAASILIIAMVWSLAYPDHRLWPPRHSTLASKVVVWGLTLVIFCSAILLGINDWNGIGWPSFRWIIGVPLVVLGNVVVWRGVAEIGFEATSGDDTGLETSGLYEYSRNPQYVADIAILVGWFVVSASLWVLPVVLAGIALLLLAPFAEEVWLEDHYGEDYRAYREKVRRYF